MPTGIVKWFNSAKGYGFICPSEGGNDVFAHFSAIIMDGYKCLKAGQKVSFEINQGPKGLHASQIKAEKSPDGSHEAREMQSPQTTEQHMATAVEC